MKNFVREFLFSMEAILISLCSPFRRSSLKHSKKKVVLVQLDVIGDFVLFSETLPWYRVLYPSDRYEIEIIGHPSWKGLLLAWKSSKDSRLSEAFDSIRDFSPKDLSYRSPLKRLAILFELASVEADIVLNPNVARTIQMDTIVHYIQSQEKIGFEGEAFEGRSHFHSRTYTKIFTNPKKSHELDIYRRFLLLLGGEDLKGPPNMNLVLSCEGSRNNVVVVSPYTSHHLKDWEPEKFDQLLVELFEKSPSQIFITGSSEQRARIEKDFTRSLKMMNVKNLAGEIRLEEMPDILASSKLVISNDSMAAHMSIATRTPLVVLLSGLHFGRFFPYRETSLDCRVIHVNWDCFCCDWKCTKTISENGPVPCISAITIDQVKESILELIKD